MNLFFALVLTGLMQALRSFSLGEGPPLRVGATLAFGYLLLTAYFMGGVFQQLRLPRITGYLVTGLLVGPSVLGVLTQEMLASLRLVNGMAIALIAMTAGSEFEFSRMRPLFRAIRAITLGALPLTMLLLCGALLLMQDLLPFMAELTLQQRVAVSLLLGVVMTAQSPAVVIALRDEMRADGPVSRTVLGVVVMADLVVILTFALVSTFAKSMLGKQADIVQMATTLAWELAGSMVVGALIGYVLAVYLRKVDGGRELFLLTVAFVVAEVGQRLHFDPLLVALAAGMLIRNATDAGDELHARIQAAALPVYILFFAVAGATLQLSVLWVVGLPALALVVVRASGLLIGTRLAAALANASPQVRRFAGFGLLPQSGLALALALLFREAFPELGVQAATLILGVIAINELSAPTLYRNALIRSGEAEAARDHSRQHISQASQGDFG